MSLCVVILNKWKRSGIKLLQQTKYDGCVLINNAAYIAHTSQNQIL